MNIAMISGWHVHAKQYAEEFNNFPDSVVSAVWDEDINRGTAWAKALGCKFYSDLDALLADDAIDGVAICSATNLHDIHIMKAIKAKKHIFTEKVLALTRDACIEIKDALEKYGLKFTIAFVHKCRPELQFVKQLSDSGELGDITYARVHNAHSGSIDDWLPAHFYDKEACGGGAMIDLGAHSMYLLAWILGKPVNYLSAFTHVTDRPVEDNAVCVMTFKDGALGVSETGFVSTGFPFIMEVSGTKGTVLVRDGSVCYSSATTGGMITPETLPEPLPSPLRMWVDSVHGGGEPPFNIDDAILLTEMMENAYLSHQKGCKITPQD